MAGSVGCGGRGWILFPPARSGKAARLEVGVGDHAHQRVTMKTLPSAAFEVIEAEFFLELLMRLFADPARLDGRGEHPAIGLSGQVGQIVFLLAGGPSFADEPDRFARHVLHALVADSLWRAVGDAHTEGGEASFSGPFVPLRQVSVRHFACLRTSSEGTERRVGTCRLRGRPRPATGKTSSTSRG